MSIRTTFLMAQEHFNNTKKPPRSKHYTENERPLRRVNENHIKLVKEPHSYVYRFAGHDSIRAYEPDEHGNYQVAVTYDGYTTVADYMYRYTGISHCVLLETTDGRHVRLPLNHQYKKQDKDFSAVLTFNPDGLLIVDQSWHADIYKKQSNKTDKDTRKHIKDKVSALVTLQMFRLPSFRANVNVSARLGQPFSASSRDININSYRILYAGLKAGDNFDTPEFVAAFDELAQSVFNSLASKRVYDKHGYRGFFSSYSAQQNANHKQEIDELHQHVVESITTDDIKTVIERKLLTMLSLNEGSDYVALPQFAESLPRKYFLVNK